MAQRIIIHLDLDAFFASCEELRHPEYKGIPLVVGSDPKHGRGRGIVTTANYAARKFGVKSAMPIGMAWRLAPDAKYVPTDHTFYSSIARKLFDALKETHPVMERVSIDEAYIDVSEEADWSTVEAVAKRIQEEVRRVSGGLSCSMGVAPNKLVAKIASDFRKPAGITLVMPEGLQEFLDPLGVRKVPGIGPRTETELHGLGIRTLEQLRSTGETTLVERFGSHGAWMIRAARGHSESAVNPEWEPNKSISAEHTFFEDTRNPLELRGTLRRMMSDLERELHDGYWWRTVTLKVRYKGFDTYTRQTSVTYPAQDTTWARREVLRLLEDALRDHRPVRLIGLRLGDLTYGLQQRSLDTFMGAPLGALVGAA